MPTTELEDSTLESVRNAVQSANFDKDFEFAYNHLGLKGTKRSEAPSVTAWELLQYARENREVFFKSFLAWSEKRRKDQLGNDAFADDRRQKFTLLDRLDEALKRDAVSRLKEFAATRPELLCETLRDIGWSCESPREPEVIQDTLSDPDATSAAEPEPQPDEQPGADPGQHDLEEPGHVSGSQNP